jgi:hypothetical protein
MFSLRNQQLLSPSAAGGQSEPPSELSESVVNCLVTSAAAGATFCASGMQRSDAHGNIEWLVHVQEGGIHV